MLEFYKHVTSGIFEYLIFACLMVGTLFTIQIMVVAAIRVVISEFFTQKLVHKHSVKIMADLDAEEKEEVKAILKD